MRMKAFALVALFAALAVYVEPSSAFEFASMTRGAAAEVVADANGYDGISVTGCAASKIVQRTCTWGSVTNLGTTDLVYKLSLTTGPASITQWCVGGNCATSGQAVSGTINVGSAAQLTATVNACLTCSNTGTAWQIEGEKANILNSLHANVAMTITWS